MGSQDSDDHVRRQLRTLQRVVGRPTDAALARRSGVAAATFSEVMAGKRRPRPEFVAKVVTGCLACARAGGQAPLDAQRVLQALRLPGHTAADAGILERDDELCRCSAMLDTVGASTGATVIIEGPAGIGKSELVKWVCAEAAVRGIVPLAARGNEQDRTLAFGGARTLLARWVAGLGRREQDTLFADAAALARIPLGMPKPRQAGPGTMIGLAEALYWLVVHATSLLGPGRARGEALLLAVDDAHWLDEESLSWLAFLNDRIAGLPLILLLAYRSHEPQPVPTLRQIALRAADVLRPKALSYDAVRTLVGRVLWRRTSDSGRVPQSDERFCAAVLDRTGGNPFYLRWMLDLALERRLAPTAGATDQVGKLTPRHAVDYLNQRLASLGPAASRLARTIAVLGAGYLLDHVARLAELDLNEAKLHYDRLCQAAILAPGPTVDFQHPIIRSAVYDSLGPSERSDAHMASARLLYDQQAAADAVAAHLLHVHAKGDPWVTDQLCQAAEDALASGLSSAAARYLARAIEEPPPPRRQCQVRLRYGQALALGPVVAALPELLAAYRQAPDEVLRTEAAVALAKAYGYADHLGDGVRMLDEALEHGTDDRVRTRLLAEQLVWATWWADDPRRLDRMRQLDRIAPRLAADTHVQQLLLVVHAWHLVLRGEPHESALAAVRPVIERGLSFTEVAEGMEVGTMAAFIPMHCDKLAVARKLFTQAVTDFNRDGWRGTHLAFAWTHLGNVALREGRVADAVADAEIALRLADRAGQRTPAHWFATGTLIQALLARGDTTEAAQVCADRDYAGRQPDALILPMPPAVHGSLLLATGQTARAVSALRQVGRWHAAAHLANPSWCPWRFDLASALRRRAPDEAVELATTGQHEADRFGCPSMRGRAARTLAAVRPTFAIDVLQESISILENAPNRLEHAYALADLGTALLRTGRTNDARTTLTEALTLADRCGALSLRTELSRKLTQTGTASIPKLPPISQLQPRQLRVAQLATDGYSDSDIAHTMVLDPYTVQTLLRDTYDQLAITSRAELAQLLP